MKSYSLETVLKGGEWKTRRFSLFRRMRSQAETRQAPVSAGERREKEEDAKEGRRKRKIEG